MVTRRFWPLVGGAEIVMANLATYFQSKGIDVRLLTARWEASWPAEFCHRNVPVTRLSQPKARGWGSIWYMRELGQWLREHSDSYDLIFVSMLKLDAYVAVRNQIRRGPPVVLRAEGGGASGDCQWQRTARFGTRVRRVTQQATRVIAPSPAIQSELWQAGYATDQVELVPNGVAVRPAATPERKRAARQTLAEVHAILEVAPDAPLVVYTGRLHQGKGLLDLIHAWPLVMRRWGNAKLWLVGEGDHAPQLWETIRELGLVQSVILPGCFDDVDEVLQAADVFVLPSYEEGLSLSLLEAMAVGLPVVASDIPGNRQLVDPQRTGMLAPPGQVERLAETLVEVLQSPEEARGRAAHGQHLVADKFSLERMGQHHLKIFEDCLNRQ